VLGPLRLLELVRHAALWGTAWGWTRFFVRWLSIHSGLPALIVAAILVIVGYRLLKKTARFAMEVAVVGALLLGATELGWIQW
jgi:hypothetical protein